jgi:MOSC domain-containing protein YiiM
MELLSINLAIREELHHEGRKVATGIFKRPAAGSVQVLRDGLMGDIQVDRQNHGGPDKAIYAYTVENYRHWEQVLGRDDFGYGFFGENFTVTALPDEDVHIGDVFQVGSVRVQVTQPRVPCFKLGAKMGDPGFVKVFLHSGRVGFYLRVLAAGEVQSGAKIERISVDSEHLSIRECMLIHGKGPEREAIMRRALGLAALSEAWRADLEKRVASL